MAQKFESKNISEATPAQIRFYAGAFLGIPVDDLNDGQVLAKVKAAHDSEEIFVKVGEPELLDQVGDPPPNVENQQGGGIVGGLGHGDPKVTLTLHAEERDGIVVNRHKEVGVNGVVWLIKRGVSVSIPYRVFLALRNAERHIITHTAEGETREQIVRSTPYNVEKMPSAAEIEAWHANTDNLFVP